MKLDRTVSGMPAQTLGLIYGAVLLGGGALAGSWLSLGLPVPACLFHRWTGLPCPTCGMTRMVRALLAGDLHQAVTVNPLVFLVVASLAAWAIVSAVQTAMHVPPYRLVVTATERVIIRLGAITALAAGWTYLIVTGA